MTVAVVALVVVVALLLADRWQQRRHADPQVLAMIDLTDRLCQRLQAPQTAIIEHNERVRELNPEEYAPPAVPPDDDDAFWASREKLAELTMQQELSDRGGH